MRDLHRRRSRRSRNFSPEPPILDATVTAHGRGSRGSIGLETASNPVAEQEERTLGEYEMEIMVQPPTEACPDVLLYPPMVVRIHQRQQRGDGYGPTAEDSGRLWAFASLTNETGTMTLAPPRADLLRGSLVDSARPFARNEDEDEDPLAEASGDHEADVPSGSYVIFPGLIIKEMGTYRIQITLGRMDLDGLSDSSSTTIASSSVAQVQSRPLRIVASSLSRTLSMQSHYTSLRDARGVNMMTDQRAIGPAENSLLTRLRRSGILIPLSPA